MGFLIRLVVTALALWVATLLVGGLAVTGDTWVESALTLLAVALIFGIVNGVLKPVIKLLGCALYILTLGLVAFVVNALLFMFTGWLADQLNLPFQVGGFWPAFWGAIVVAVVSWLINLVIPDRIGGD